MPKDSLSINGRGRSITAFRLAGRQDMRVSYMKEAAVAYKVLADVIVAVHFLWIVFLVLGGAWGGRHRTVRLLHIGGLAFAVLLQVFGWYCPLTYAEAWLRRRHSPGLAYSGSFIIHYMERFVYLSIDPRVILGVTLMLAAFYIHIYLKRRY